MTTSNNPTTWPVYSLAQAVGRLPYTAQAKYRALAALADDSAALTRAVMERSKRLEEQLYHCEMRLGRLDPRSGEADTINKLQLDRDALRIEVNTVEQRRSLLNARRSNCEQVLSQLQAAIPLLVERGGGGALRPVTITAQPREGEDLKAAILRVRSTISNANTEITRLRTAPCTADEIRAAAIAKVEQMAAQGAPHIGSDSGTVEIRFPDEPQFADPGTVMAAPSGSASKLLAWLFPDQMLARLTASLDDGVPGGVSKEEREARIAELAAEVRELEHAEESLVVQALDAGLDVHRRPTASPFALLGLEVETEAALIAAE
jgi:hypothetical protein